jgi:hypothetical protein
MVQQVPKVIFVREEIAIVSEKHIYVPTFGYVNLSTFFLQSKKTVSSGLV